MVQKNLSVAEKRRRKTKGKTNKQTKQNKKIED